MKKLLALSLLAIIFSGCGSYQSIKHLKADKIDTDEGFNSILILHLTIIDKSGKLPDWGNVNLWERYIGKTQEENRMSQYIIEPEWKKTEDGHQCTETIYLQTRGGDHKILSIAFQNSSEILPFKTRIDYAVPGNAIAYLGNLILTVEKDYKYGYAVSHNKNDKEAVLGEFSKKFPGLYEKFEKKYILVESRKVGD